VIDAVLFDIDGTIVDARRDIANAMNYALRTLGLRELSVGEIASHVGTGVSWLVSNCLGSDDPKLVGRGTELYGQYYMAHPSDEARLYPHAVEILEYLKGRRLFIITNRYTAFAEAVLGGLGIRKYFEAVIGGDDEACLKPSACVIDGVVSRYGIDKARSLIVGDMDVDIMAGRNSGVKTCWVTHGLGRIEDIKHLKPDYIIEDLIELKEIVK
jgi:phosphoglycolate phosphatase-like HAD superfamily hydrolase